MKGIIPINQVSQPYPLTLEFMLERVSQREIAKECQRCGGTGSFSSVDFGGIGSRYGSHSFNCGDAWKVPLGWSKFTANDVLQLFISSKLHFSVKEILERFIETKLLKKNVANLVRIAMYLKQHGLEASIGQVDKIQNVVREKSEDEIKILLKLLIVHFKNSGKINLGLLSK